MIAEIFITDLMQQGGDAFHPLLSTREAIIMLLSIGAGVARTAAYSRKRRFSDTPNAGGTRAASAISEDVERRLRAIHRILNLVVKTTLRPEDFVILIYGPGAPSPVSRDPVAGKVWNVRCKLKDALEDFGFIAAFGEDIEEATKGDKLLNAINIAVKEKAVASKAVTVVILAASTGAATEVGVVSQSQLLSSKSIIAIHEYHGGGFMAKGASREAEMYGARVIFYKDTCLESGELKERLFDELLKRYEGALVRSMSNYLQQS
jgi:hypothetical protein